MRAFQIVNTYTHVYIYILVLVMEILDSSTIPRSRLSRSIEKTRIPQEMDRYKFSILLLRKLLLHDRYYYQHRVIDPIQFNPRLDQNLVENLERMIRSSLVIEHSTVNRKSSLTETRLRFIERRCDESVGKYRLEDAKSGGGVVFHVARIGGGIKLVTSVSKWINEGSSARFSFFLNRRR